LRCNIIIKEGRRKRYIGFTIKQKDNIFDKNEIINEIRNQCTILFDKNYRDLGLYLVRFNGEQGILRCKHTEKQNAIQLLNSMKKVSSKNVEIETLGTSGTIKTLIKKHMKDF
jgi:RNase P/RNase MRP subunit POP5